MQLLHNMSGTPSVLLHYVTLGYTAGLLSNLAKGTPGTITEMIE